MRENIFTAFAKSIELFCEHKITKKELFQHFVNSVEIASKDEVEERKNHLKALDEWSRNGLQNMMNNERPYSNYEKAIDSLS